MPARPRGHRTKRTPRRLGQFHETASAQPDANHITKAMTAMTPTAPANAGYFSVNQASEYLGLSRATLYRAIDANRIPYLRDPLTGRVRFNRADLDEWMRGRKGRKA